MTATTASSPSSATATGPAPPPARARLLLGVLVLTGVLLDLAIQTPADGVALFAAAVVVVIGLLTLGGLGARTGRALVILALLPSLFLALRTSPWVVIPDLLAAGLLLALGTSLPTGRRLVDLRFGDLARLPGTSAGATLAAPGRIVPVASRALPSAGGAGRQRAAAIGRGVGLAVPVVVVLGLLLASADAVFASLLDLDLDVSGLPLHLVLVALGTWGTAGLFLHARRAAARPERRPPLTVGAVEGLVVLSGLIAVYALFAVARLLVTLRGHEYVLDATGLTYAEYARSGFFQLLWAAGITLVVLLGLRAIVILDSPGSRRAFSALAVIAVALTLVVVQTAIVRLGLYEDAFGLTMLRLYSTAFAWWIGVVFVLVGLVLMGLRRRREWLPSAVLVTALATVLLVNLANPEQLVVERNVGRATQGAQFDATYVASLSDDAVPALVAALDDLEPTQRHDVLWALCRRRAAPEPPSWNLAARRARQALDASCQ